MQRGFLVLVVGPSGAGKDTLIDGARAALAGDAHYLFARRAITRPADAGGEDHEAVSTDNFEHRLASGEFALHWRAHGLSYALPKAVAEALHGGRCVVANVSRTVVPEARARYAPIRVINVTAPADILAERLARRGREADSAVVERIARSTAVAVGGEDVTTLENVGALPDRIADFVALITDIRARLRPGDGV